MVRQQITVNIWCQRLKCDDLLIDQILDLMFQVNTILGTVPTAPELQEQF